MTYALNLDPETGRILSATEDQYGVEGQPRVEELPEGDISEYLYVDGEYVYSPLPPEYPTVSEDIVAGKVFSIGEDFYRATTSIPRGEPVTRYNSEPVSIAEIMNALQEAQKGE